MKIYNPTNEVVVARHDGNIFEIRPGKYISVTETTGEWIIDRYKTYGIVNIDPSDGVKDYKLFLVKKTMEGIKNKLDHLYVVVDQFIVMDTNVKEINGGGTVMNSRPVKNVVDSIAVYTSILKSLEEKFGFSIASDDYKAKLINIEDSVNSIVAAFEADEESKKIQESSQAEVDAVISEAIGDLRRQ